MGTSGLGVCIGDPAIRLLDIGRHTRKRGFLPPMRWGPDALFLLPPMPAPPPPQPAPRPVSSLDSFSLHLFPLIFLKTSQTWPCLSLTLNLPVAPQGPGEKAQTPLHGLQGPAH